VIGPNSFVHDAPSAEAWYANCRVDPLGRDIRTSISARFDPLACIPGRTTAHVRLSRLSKLREYCSAIAVPDYRVYVCNEEMLATGIADVLLEERPKLALNRRPVFRECRLRAQKRSFHNRSFPRMAYRGRFFFHSCRDYVMLPGMKQRIARLPLKYHVQTIVRPARFRLGLSGRRQERRSIGCRDGLGNGRLWKSQSGSATQRPSTKRTAQPFPAREMIEPSY